MAANSLAVSLTILRDEGQRIAGWNKAFASWSATQIAHFAAAVASAQRWCYYPPVLPTDELRGMCVPHIWSFMTQVQTLTLRAPYSTGTISVTTGTVTLASGTWPTWAASGDLWYSGARYSVASRTNGTTLVLDDTSLTGVSGASYELILHYYPLPSDFGSLIGDGFTYPRQSPMAETKFKRVPERRIRELDRDFAGSGYPCEFALSWIAPTATDDARQQVQFFPLNGTEQTIEYKYEPIPVALDGSSYVYHHGGPWFGELLIKATCAELVKKVKGADTSAYQAAHQERMDALAAAVGYDRRTAAVESLGRPPADDALLEDVLDSVRRDIPMSLVTVDV